MIKPINYKSVEKQRGYEALKQLTENINPYTKLYICFVI